MNTPEADRTEEELILELHELREEISRLRRSTEELKQAEEALCKSESFLNDVFDSIQDGISILDNGLNIVRVNHVLEKWHPYAMPIVGKKCYSAYHGRSTACDHCPSLKALKEKTMQSAIVPLQGEMGARRGWLEIFSFPITDSEGNVKGVIEHVRDITERKRAEDYLRLARFAMDKFNDSAIWLDERGKIVYVNETACKSLGYSREELLSMHIWDIDPDYPSSIYSAEWREAYRQDGFKKFESRHVARDGRVFPVEVTSSYIKYGDKEYLITFDRDITGRKRAEESLRESEEKFKVLAETSAAAIFVYRGTHFVSVNRAAERISGYSKDELLKMSFLDIIHPDFKELVLERSRARQRGEPVPPEYEFKIITKSGETRWVEITAGRIVYKGMPAGVATLFDITERKRAGRELEEAKDHAELYLDLMGHDINNMNQVGMGFLELALQSPGIREQDKGLLLKSLGSLENSSRLIGNIRKVQKARSGELAHHEVDACQMILRALAHYSNLPDIRASFSYELPPHCPVIANDLAYEIFENLIGNAIKHGGYDPVIGVKLDAATLDGKKYNKFTVEDNGPGVPDAMKECIFNRQQRGDTKAKGSGLGLYLVKSLVDSFDGRLWVEDRVSGDHTKGSRFVVMLPALGN